MKKIVCIFFLLLGVGLYAETNGAGKNSTVVATPVSTKTQTQFTGATRGNVKILEASERIRYLSQKIVKDYLYFYRNQKSLKTMRRLSKSLTMLDDSFRSIAATTSSRDTKDILEFLAYSKDQIKEIFAGKVDREKAALMLDYGEILLEGADSIANLHKYTFSSEEKMLATTKQLEYLLERTTKNYIALHTGFGSLAVKEQMKDAIDGLEKSIRVLNAYSYPSEMRKEHNNLNRLWKTSKEFLVRAEQLFIPNLILGSTERLEGIIEALSLHHSKNQ